MIVYTLPIIAALTGYITNYIAVKMLFHPRKPLKLVFFEVQGIFPKRQQKLAEKLGQIVSRELFSAKDITSAMQDPAALDGAREVISQKIDVFLNEKLGSAMPMLAMFLNDSVKGTIKDTLMTEFNAMLPDLVGQYASRIEEQVDVEAIVYEKVVNFSTDKLEEILYSIMKKEFKFIELLGGILGFIIGLIQLGMLQLA